MATADHTRFLHVLEEALHELDAEKFDRYLKLIRFTYIGEKSDLNFLSYQDSVYVVSKFAEGLKVSLDKLREWRDLYRSHNRRIKRRLDMIIH